MFHTIDETLEQQVEKVSSCPDPDRALQGKHAQTDVALTFGIWERPVNRRDLA